MDICVSEAQYIFNEVSCLEQIPSHPRLIELFSFGIAGKFILFMYNMLNIYFEYDIT